MGVESLEPYLLPIALIGGLIVGVTVGIATGRGAGLFMVGIWSIASNVALAYILIKVWKTHPVFTMIVVGFFTFFAGTLIGGQLR